MEPASPPLHSPARRLGRWLHALLARLKPARRPPPPPPSDEQRARDLIAAIDAGGLPLNPARVNDIARRLGLEVARDAPMTATIARIRAVLDR